MVVGLLSQVEGLRRRADRHCECEKEVMCEDSGTTGGRVDGANAQQGGEKIRPSLPTSWKPQSASEHRAVGEIEHFGSST